MPAGDPLDFAGLIRELLQQQAALLELQRETVRLQRLLIERALEVATSEAPPAPAPASDVPGVSVPEPGAVSDPPRLHLVDTNGAPGPEPVQPAPASPTVRSARYLQPPTARPARPVTRQHVDRVTRLYEAGDAAHLVLQFGEYKGSTLFQVAEMDPDYVRRLALTAQRPQVRAAARQLVVALEASEQAAKGSGSKTRRVRADGR